MLAWFLDESNSQFGFNITDVQKQEQSQKLGYKKREWYIWHGFKDLCNLTCLKKLILIWVWPPNELQSKLLWSISVRALWYSQTSSVQLKAQTNDESFCWHWTKSKPQSTGHALYTHIHLKASVSSSKVYCQAVKWKIQRGTYSKSWCYMYYWLLQLLHILAKPCNTSYGSVRFFPFRLCRSKSSPHAAFSLDSFMQLAPEFPSLSYCYGFGINPWWTDLCWFHYWNCYMIHYKVRNNISQDHSQFDISLQILKQHKNSKTSFQFSWNSFATFLCLSGMHMPWMYVTDIHKLCSFIATTQFKHMFSLPLYSES
jgi:hypothetical protein